MADETKFSEEEMKELKEIQEYYVQIQHKLGQLSVAKIRLENQIKSLDDTEKSLIKSFNDTQLNEKKFIDKITEKYGEGTLDPETGAFITNN